jgi:hypothetical protein
VAAVGAGAYGVSQFMSGGSSPATAVPANAIAYVSLDLDPSGAQKIEAIKIMRKFPGLRSELKIGSRDDLRRTIFEEALKDSGCSVSYTRDIKPWIGERIAFAGVPRSGKVEPLVALQVSDEDKARAAVRRLDRCDDSRDATGVAFVGDYMLLAKTDVDAAAMAKSAESATLADDAGFTTWMGRVGDPGILTIYAAKGAGETLLDEARSGAGMSGDSGEKQLAATVKNFQGAAGVVRFKGGAVEAELSSKGLGSAVAATTGTGPDVRTLPGTTAAALSVSLRSGWLDSLGLNDDKGFADLMRQGEAATGLQLPGDVETLLGSGFDVSIDSSADFATLTSSPDPTKLPFGIRIKGDPTKIKAVIAKLQAAAGPSGDVLTVASSGDLVAVGTDPAYVKSLLAKGDLGDSTAFTRVVPDAGRSSGTLFVDFDAGNGWAERLADALSDGDKQVVDNIKPLDAFGTSGWQDSDGVQHALIRLTTD